MKTFLVLLLAISSLSIASAAMPDLPLIKAVEIAQNSLRSKGMENSAFIQSVSLSGPTLMNKTPVWIIKWSDSIPGSKKGIKEVGLKIKMNGDVVHLISDGKPAYSPH